MRFFIGRNMAQKTTLLALLFVSATSAAADPIGGWILENLDTDPISPTNGNALISLSVWYDPNAGYHSFGQSDVVVGASDSRFLGSASGYGSNGTITHNAFTQLNQSTVLFQAWNPHVPPVLIASTENPAWTATFWFETTDFTPRTVEISTSSLTFGMFDTTTSINSTYLPLSSVQETTLKIQIIPAPSSALALLAGAGMLTVRRRRG